MEKENQKSPISLSKETENEEETGNSADIEDLEMAENFDEIEFEVEEPDGNGVPAHEMNSSDFDEEDSDSYIYEMKHFNGDDEPVGHHEPKDDSNY